jgi:hypothetical protein
MDELAQEQQPHPQDQQNTANASGADINAGGRAVTVTMTEIINDFTKLMQLVNIAFNQDPDLSHSVKHERERLAAALISVAQFSRKYNALVAHRFFELGSAIADLNSGIQCDLLKPARSGSQRPPHSSQVWRARARVVLGLDALIRSGLTQAAAAKNIAKEFPLLKSLVSEKRCNDKILGIDLSQTIVNWRKKSPSWKNWEAVTVYKEGKEIIMEKLASNGNKDDLVAFANGQLKSAVDFCYTLHTARETKK